MTNKKEDTIILEPFTKITSFDGIGYAASRSLIGAIGRYLYPEEGKKEERRKFYASPVGRRNKQTVAELVSELYAYLNGIISEHADPRQYYFRLSVRMEVNRRTGEVLGHPYFDVDVFRHIGKIGGKPTEIGEYVLKVNFVGREGVPISQVFIKGISEVVRNTGMVVFKPYETYSSAPKEVRDKITKTYPYLIIGDEAYEIKVKMDEKSVKIIPYIQEGKETFEFNDEKEVMLFILKKIAIKPDILNSETVFELVDKEIKGFSPNIASAVVEPEKAEKVFSISSLGIEAFLSKFSKKLNKLDSVSLPSNLIKQSTKHKRVLDDIKQRFEDLKIKYEVTEQELNDMEKERLEGILEEDKYHSTKKRRLIAFSTLRTELVKLQQELKEEVFLDVRRFLREVNKATRGGKEHAKK